MKTRKNKVRDEAIKAVLGTVPSHRYNPKTTLMCLAEKYPSIMHTVAEHIANRMDEEGDNIPAGKRLLIELEAEALSIRAVLLAGIVEDGILDEDGNKHSHLPLALRLTGTVSQLVSKIDDAPGSPNTGQDAITVNRIWDAAISGEPIEAGDDTDTDTDADDTGTDDTDTDTNTEGNDSDD